MFQARLYQKEAIKFFANNNGRVLISLPPGAGKTFIAMYTRYLCADLHTTVILCPASIRIQWYNEWRKFFPKDKVLLYDPNKLEDLSKYDCIILNYEKLGIKVNGKNFIDNIGINFNYLIIDECHFVKNSESSRGDLSFKLSQKADRVMLLSGTPVTNRVTDLWNQFRILNPQAIGSLSTFKQLFCSRHLEIIKTKQGNRKVWKEDNKVTNIESLKRLISMFVFFRDERAVYKEMPPIQKVVVPLELDTQSILEYKNILNSVKDITNESLTRIEGIISSMRLRIGLSKVDPAVEWIKNFLNSSTDGTKLVIFGYHRKVVELLYKKLSMYNPALVYGGMSDSDKNLNVSKFCKDNTCRLFIGNISSAGTGLDGLNTVSNKCVFVEYSYSAAEQKQAEGRIRRTNSKYSNYLSYYLFADGTIDSTIFDIIDSKAKTSSEIFEKRELNPEELLSILKKCIRG